MTEQGDHIVLKCSGVDCGMRYPCPADHERRDQCPLCEAPTEVVGQYASAPQHQPAEPTGETSLVAVLDSIRSALNVGTMLRSADGASIDHVYLCGLTAAADHPKVIKTALGAHESVPTTSYKDIATCLAALRADGFAVWAIDATETSQPLESVSALPAKVAFVVGNELAGVDPLILADADHHVHLRMFGHKTTINVGVAFGTVAYWLRSVASPEPL